MGLLIINMVRLIADHVELYNNRESEGILKIEVIRLIENQEQKKKCLGKFLQQLLDDVYGNVNRRVEKIIQIYQYLIEFKDYYEEERDFKSMVFSKLDEFLCDPLLNEMQRLEFGNIKTILGGSNINSILDDANPIITHH